MIKKYIQINLTVQRISYTRSVVVKLYTGVNETFFGVHEIFRVYDTHLGVHKILKLKKKHIELD